MITLTPQEKKLVFYGTLFVLLYLFFLYFSMVILRFLPVLMSMYLLKMIVVEVGRWAPILYIVLLGVVYYFLFRAFWTKKLSAHSLQIIIFFACIFNVLLLLSFPILSSDITGYISRASIITDYHMNPYQYSPNDVDPLMLTNWGDVKMTYGPLWGLISSYVKIFSKSIAVNLFTFRLVTIFFSIGSAFLVYAIVKRIKPDFRYNALLLYLWNPLILIEVASSGHNDIALVFFLLLAIYYLIIGRRYLSFVALALSLLIKYVSVLALPFFLIYYLKKAGTNRERVRLVCFSSVIVLACIVIVSFPFFGDGFLGGIFQHSNALNSRITFGGIANIIVYFVTVIVFHMPLEAEFTANIIINSNAVVLAVFTAIMVVVYFLKRNNASLERLLTVIFVMMLSVAFFSPFFFQPWYYLWVIAPAIVWGVYYKGSEFSSLVVYITIAGLLGYFLFNVLGVLVATALFIFEYNIRGAVAVWRKAKKAPLT